MSRLKQREIWKVYPNNTNYVISNMGRIKRAKDSNPCGKHRAIAYKKDKILKPSISVYGYCTKVLSTSDKKKQNIQIHRAVLETFVGPCPEGMECNHKDVNPLNNNLSNLEWMTHQENANHSWVNGRISIKGERIGISKLKEGEVWLIKKLLANKITLHLIAKMFKVHHTTIFCIKNGKSWGWLNYP